MLGPLLFLLYINDMVNCINDEDVKLVLYADDTNIFITENDKNNLIQKGNHILKAVNEFMKSNLLHINIDNLHKKLKSATGILKRICNNIPETHYKSLYFAFFESHLCYCITVFGNVCKTHSEKLFTIQKHCMRILFGDKEAYLDKFKTSCRTRPIKTQILGTSYYMKEHTKPLFHKHKILAFKNLYNYQICLETLKILKTKIPYYLFQLHPLSSRNNQNFLVAKRNSSLFITNRIKLWNNCLKVISNTQTIPETKISKFKLDLKKILLKVQNAFDKNEWYLEHNFSLSYQIISTI